MKPKLGSLFSGIGGIDLAFQRAGFDIAFQVEIDEFCNKVLSKHWPNVPRFGDIKTVRGSGLPAIDVLAGGFPCQDISSAGKGEGIKEGNRSGLWFEFARLIGEIRPAIVFLENVPAITGRGGSTVVSNLAALGYDCEWGTMAAADAGAPHKRERWFCVAHTCCTSTRMDQSRTSGQKWRDADSSQSAILRSGDGKITPEGIGPSCVDVAYAISNGTKSDRTSGTVGSAPRSGQGRQEEWQRIRDAIGDSSTHELADSQSGGAKPAQFSGQWGSPIESCNMGNTPGERLSRFGQSELTTMESQGKSGNIETNRNRQDDQLGNAIDPLRAGSTQSVLGRAVDGLSRQLDGHQWPGRPGEAQHAWEAPRTGKGIPNRAKRLKALGNAVVPQVVCPIAVAIREIWFQ